MIHFSQRSERRSLARRRPLVHTRALPFSRREAQDPGCPRGPCCAPPVPAETFEPIRATAASWEQPETHTAH